MSIAKVPKYGIRRSQNVIYLNIFKLKFFSSLENVDLPTKIIKSQYNL